VKVFVRLMSRYCNRGKSPGKHLPANGKRGLCTGVHSRRMRDPCSQKPLFSHTFSMGPRFRGDDAADRAAKIWCPNFYPYSLAIGYERPGARVAGNRERPRQALRWQCSGRH